MQHTLVPEAARSSLRREYRIRVIIVACFSLSVAGIVGSGALFPAFIRALQEERSQLNMIASLKKNKDDSGITAIEGELDRDALMVKAMQPSIDMPSYSDIVEDVVRLRGAVKVMSVSVEQTATTTMNIIIQGISPTRDALVAYKSRLENLSPNNTVELPLSDLAKSKDIAYSLKVTHKLK